MIAKQHIKYVAINHGSFFIKIFFLHITTGTLQTFAFTFSTKKSKKEGREMVSFFARTFANLFIAAVCLKDAVSNRKKVQEIPRLEIYPEFVFQRKVVHSLVLSLNLQAALQCAYNEKFCMMKTDHHDNFHIIYLIPFYSIIPSHPPLLSIYFSATVVFIIFFCTL